MTQKKLRPTSADWKDLLAADADLMRGFVRHVLQEILGAEMTEALGLNAGRNLTPRCRAEPRPEVSSRYRSHCGKYVPGSHNTSRAENLSGACAMLTAMPMALEKMTMCRVFSDVTTVS